MGRLSMGLGRLSLEMDGGVSEFLIVRAISIFLSLVGAIPARSRARQVVRLDDEIRERLESFARKDQLSLNHVMNTGLREYAEWGAIYRNVGLAAVSKRLLREMFDSLPEEKARELGRRNGREEGPQMTIHWFGSFNIQNVLRTFGTILARYSGTFIFEHTQEGRIHTVVIRHEMGRHASAYYAEYARTICGLLRMKCSVSETDAQILVKAEEPVAALAESAMGLPAVLAQEANKL